MESQRVVIGVDIGQKIDSTAIVVCEVTTREIAPARIALPAGPGLFTGADARRIPAATEEHYSARHVERLPLGTPYPAVADRVAAVVAGLVRRGIARPRLMVDATGVGAPVVDLIGERLGRHRRDLIAVSFTHGDRFTQDDDRRTASLGKAFLVSKLQALLQSRRLHLPANAESTALAAELLSYEIRVDEDANDRYGAFKTGTHDDIVTALGLACVYTPGPSRRVRVFAGIA